MEEQANGRRINALPKELRGFGIDEDAVFSRDSISDMINKRNGIKSELDNSHSNSFEQDKIKIMDSLKRLEEENRELRKEINEIKKKISAFC